LGDLPKNLNDSYDVAMKRIDDQSEEDRKIAHSALTWVSNAKTPLTVAELRTALAIEPGDRQLDEGNLMDIDIIISVCAGLVVLDEQLSVVRLVHYTTQEYLDSIQAEKFPDAQTDITRTLLTFLAFDGFPHSSWEDRGVDLPPLVQYSEYCLAHAAGKPEVELRDMLVEFLGRAFQWNQVMGWRWQAPPWNITFTDWPTLHSALWIAAEANLMGTATFLLEEAPMSKHSDGSEICIASSYGQLKVVQLLVENGADVNTPSELHGPPLVAASAAGHKSIIRFLLENGADVNARGGRYGSALHAALAEGCEQIVQLLIKHGADVNLQVSHINHSEHLFTR
jgi:hypothetical protein